ncbi:hypothetical protein JXA80_10600 [bacterium]|nr:hypothetical protein [candidate division CSSED10-310 bacterium]
MNPTGDTIQWFHRPFPSMVTSAAIAAVAASYPLPGPAHPPITFLWPGAVCLAAIIPTGGTITGYLIGTVAGTIFQSDYAGLSRGPSQSIVYIALTGLCLLTSMTMARSRFRIGLPVFYLILAGMLIPLAIVTAMSPPITISLVHFAAAGIVTFLTAMKSPVLRSILPCLVISWMTGYGPWAILVVLLKLDPFSYADMLGGFRAYFLLPHAVYLLQILIGAHLVAGRVPDRSGNRLTAND